MYSSHITFILLLAEQHRYHWPVSGIQEKRFPIDGSYNTVNPIAVRKDIDVYTDNRRTICPIQTEDFGTVIVICIAATMVGSINFECQCPQSKDQRFCEETSECMVGKRVKKFDGHGYFAFGGSTLMTLFLPGGISFDLDIKGNSNKQLETLVRVGSSIGRATGKYSKKGLSLKQPDKWASV
jgi:phosphatidylserine decarboxylase